MPIRGEPPPDTSRKPLGCDPPKRTCEDIQAVAQLTRRPAPVVAVFRHGLIRLGDAASGSPWCGERCGMLHKSRSAQNSSRGGKASSKRMECRCSGGRLCRVQVAHGHPVSSKKAQFARMHPNDEAASHGMPIEWLVGRPLIVGGRVLAITPQTGVKNPRLHRCSRRYISGVHTMV